MKKLYRYDIQYGNGPELIPTDVVLYEYFVTKETEKCFFLNASSSGYWKSKRMSKVKAKDSTWYAAETEKIAMKQFKRRIAKRISWYKYWLWECEIALKIAEDIT